MKRKKTILTYSRTNPFKNFLYKTQRIFDCKFNAQGEKLLISIYMDKAKSSLAIVFVNRLDTKHTQGNCLIEDFSNSETDQHFL